MKNQIKYKKNSEYKSYYSNKTIWITGASSGIGKAIFEELLKTGEDINFVLSSRNQNILEEMIDVLGADTNKILILTYDAETLGDEKAKELVEKIFLKFNSLDIVFYCAGVSTRYLVEENYSTSIDKKVMQINFFSNITLTKAILPKMCSNGFGHFIIITSLIGKIGWINRSSYSASKHALHGYFESLALELKNKGIRVTMAVPGAVKTNIDRASFSFDGKKWNQYDPMIQSGMLPSTCAKAILKATRKQKNEVVIGSMPKLILFFEKIFPRIF